MELLASNCKTAVWKEERQLGLVHFQELCSSVSGGEDHPPGYQFVLLHVQPVSSAVSVFNLCTGTPDKMLVISLLHQDFVACYFSVLLKTFLLHFFVCSSFQTQQKAIWGRKDPAAFLWVVGEVSISHEERKQNWHWARSPLQNAWWYFQAANGHQLMMEYF